MKPQTDPEIPALDELELLNGLLEHRVRLAICVLLSKHDAMSFSGLKRVLDETDGSLGTHLRKLEDFGYLSIEKTYRANGRISLKRHLAILTRLIDWAV